MNVRYHCQGCMRSKELDIPDRDDDQIISEWMEVLAATIASDHGRYSPRCGQKVVDLYIPMDDQLIGIDMGAVN